MYSNFNCKIYKGVTDGLFVLNEVYKNEILLIEKPLVTSDKYIYITESHDKILYNLEFKLLYNILLTITGKNKSSLNLVKDINLILKLASSAKFDIIDEREIIAIEFLSKIFLLKYKFIMKIYKIVIATNIKISDDCIGIYKYCTFLNRSLVTLKLPQEPNVYIKFDKDNQLNLISLKNINMYDELII